MTEFRQPVDGDHALLVGQLVGMVMRTKTDHQTPYDVEILNDDEGNHLATFKITAPSGVYFIHVEKFDESAMLRDELLRIEGRLQ